MFRLAAARLVKPALAASFGVLGSIAACDEAKQPAKSTFVPGPQDQKLPATGSGLKIFSGNGNSELATAVANHLGENLGKAKVSQFADGEVRRAQSTHRHTQT